MTDTSSAIRERRSIRGYLPMPVAADVVDEILTEARWAPSAGNTQCTDVLVVTGEALERVKAALREQAESEAAPAPDIAGASWPEAIQARMTTMFQARVAFVAAEQAKRGVAPADPPVPPMVAMAGLFGAPVLLLLVMDKDVSTPYGCFDAGLFGQTIALAAHDRGLGTCLMTSTVRNADALHRVLPEAAGKAFIAAITLGYPDPDAPINRFPRQRLALDDFVTRVR
jgi:nitroreductase